MAETEPRKGSAGLACEVAERVRARYSRGIRRVPLTDLGIAPFNRAISPKYVHALFGRILRTQGFTRFRYKNAIGLSPNPAAPLSVADHTNAEVARAAGLLASVPNKPLIGLATKNHLVLGLQAILSNNVRWDDAPTTTMSAPAQEGDRHQELHESLAEGIYVEVLSADAWEESPDVLRKLMESDNLDSQTCLADHEIHQLEKIHRAIGAASPSSGETLWSVVWRGLDSLGDTFSEDDCVHLFNFALSLGKEHIAAVRLFHFHYVNPQALRVEPCLLGWLAQMPERCPLVRVALLCHAYMVDPKYYARCGHYFLARGLTEAQVKAAASGEAGAARLAEIESFLWALVRVVDLSTTQGTVLKSVASLLCRAGSLILRPSVKTECEAFAKVELKFRSDLEQGVGQAAPPVVLKTTEAIIQKTAVEAAARTSARGGPMPSASAALTFNADGILVEHLAFKANQRGIVQGGRVRCATTVDHFAYKAKRRCITAGEAGVVVGFKASAVQVRWDADGGEDQGISVPLKNIEPEEQASKPAVAVAAASPNVVAGAATANVGASSPSTTTDAASQSTAVAAASPTTSWKLVDTDLARRFLASILETTLFHMHATCGSGPAVVGRVRGAMFACRDMDAMSLCMVPLSGKILATKPAGIPSFSAQARVKDSQEMTFHICKDMESTGVEDETLAPFWEVQWSSGENGNLFIHRVPVATAGHVRVEAGGFAATQKKCPVNLCIPVLRNEKPLKAGETLVACVEEAR